VQSVVLVCWPVNSLARDVSIEHPEEVWSVIWFVVESPTPSRISISPPLGQFGPTVQYAGHMVGPWGMANMSVMKSPCEYELGELMRTLLASNQ
jgi:hypothetical protein